MGYSSHSVPPAQLNKPAPTFTPVAPPASSHSSTIPSVTRDLGVPSHLTHSLEPPLSEEDISQLTHEQAFAMMKKLTGVPLQFQAFEVRWRLLQEHFQATSGVEDPGRSRKQRQ